MTPPTPLRPDDLTQWIARLYQEPDLLRMGHNQGAQDLNLGLGWVYYALARLLQPRRAVVIGSYRGFVPLCIGRACQENLARGTVTFIDPSFVDEFWKDPARTRAWFAGFGLHNVEHHLATTQQFAESEAYRQLDEVGLLFIDGYHTAEQARFDYRAFEPLLAPRALVLLHDSMVLRTSPIYGPDRQYEVDVKHFIDELRSDPGLQLLDLPFGTGLTVLRKRGGTNDEPLLTSLEGRSRS
jgi:predicted O-methyltransferase YrrM